MGHREHRAARRPLRPGGPTRQLVAGRVKHVPGVSDIARDVASSAPAGGTRRGLRVVEDAAAGGARRVEPGGDHLLVLVRPGEARCVVLPRERGIGRADMLVDGIRGVDAGVGRDIQRGLLCCSAPRPAVARLCAGVCLPVDEEREGRAVIDTVDARPSSRDRDRCVRNAGAAAHPEVGDHHVACERPGGLVGRDAVGRTAGDVLCGCAERDRRCVVQVKVRLHGTGLPLLARGHLVRDEPARPVIERRQRPGRCALHGRDGGPQREVECRPARRRIRVCRCRRHRSSGREQSRGGADKCRTPLRASRGVPGGRSDRVHVVVLEADGDVPGFVVHARDGRPADRRGGPGDLCWRDVRDAVQLDAEVGVDDAGPVRGAGDGPGVARRLTARDAVIETLVRSDERVAPCGRLDDRARAGADRGEHDITVLDASRDIDHEARRRGRGVGRARAVLDR